MGNNRAQKILYTGWEKQVGSVLVIIPKGGGGGGRHQRRIISREFFGVWEKSRGKKGLLWTHFRSGQSHVPPPPSPPSFDEQGVQKEE